MTKDVRFLIAPCIFLFLSWAKFIDTHSVGVDDNFFTSDFKILSNYLISFGAMGYAFFLFRKYLSEQIVIAEYTKTNSILAVLCFFTLPMYSSDIFSILSFGTMDHFNSNVYSSYDIQPSNLYYDYVYTIYRKVPCVYGPLNLLIAKLCQISNQSVLANLICIKFIFFLFHLGFILLVRFFSGRLKNRIFNERYLSCIPLFPLFWFQGFMQLHNDVLALVLSILGVILLFNYHRIQISILLFTAAFSIKFNFIFVYGILLVYWFDLRYKVNYFKIATAISTGFLFVVLVYFSFIETWIEALNPLKVLSALGTHGSLKDILGLLGAFYDKSILFKVYDFVLITCFVILFYYRLKKKVLTSWFQFVLIALVILITFYAHRFFPWYLLALLFFFSFQFPNSDNWWNWLIGISLAYCLQDLSVQIPHHSILFHFNVGLTTAMGIVAIFWHFKIRFFK